MTRLRWGRRLALAAAMACLPVVAQAAPAGVPAPAGRARARAIPRAVRLGAMTIDRYTDARTGVLIAKTIFSPLPNAGFPGTVTNLNGKPIGAAMPERFIIGDGGTTRVFIGVDRRPGALLHRKITRFIGRIPTRSDGTRDPEVVIEFLRTEVNRTIRWTAGSSANDGRAEMHWDRKLQVGSAAASAFRSVANAAIGDAAADAGQDFTVVPFEHYLRKGEGYCIQKALLASLVLEELKIPHRLVNGAVLGGPGQSTGHTWIELADGRIFDPAWSSVGHRGPSSSSVPGAFRFGGSERMENAFYPVLEASSTSGP